MPTASRYPDKNNGGPTPVSLVELAPSYASALTIFEDGSVESNLPEPLGTRRWIATYDGLTAVQSALLDAHLREAEGTVREFLFYDHIAGRLYDGVQYDEFDVGEHRRHYSAPRVVRLVRYP